MPMSNLARWLLVTVSAVVLLAAVGCGGDGDNNGGGGGDEGCSNACNHMFNCATQLGVTLSDYVGPHYVSISSCINRCMTGGCPRTRELTNCLVAVPCVDIVQVVTANDVCFSRVGCVP